MKTCLRACREFWQIFIHSTHVHECGLGSADDSAIWRFAKENGYTIISKDSDFQDRSILYGQPPKLIWMRAANCSTLEIEKILRLAAQTIQRFIEEDEESFLILGPRRKPSSSKGKHTKR